MCERSIFFAGFLYLLILWFCINLFVILVSVIFVLLRFWCDAVETAQRPTSEFGIIRIRLHIYPSVDEFAILLFNESLSSKTSVLAVLKNRNKYLKKQWFIQRRTRVASSADRYLFQQLLTRQFAVSYTLRGDINLLLFKPSTVSVCEVKLLTQAPRGGCSTKCNRKKFCF